MTRRSIFFLIIYNVRGNVSRSSSLTPVMKTCLIAGSVDFERSPKPIGIGRHRAQVHQLKSFPLDLLNHDTQYLSLRLLFLGQKHQPRSILSFFGHRNALKQNKLMRNLDHNAGSIAVLSHFCPTMAHVLKHMQCIVHQFMTLASMDVIYTYYKMTNCLFSVQIYFNLFEYQSFYFQYFQNY